MTIIEELACKLQAALELIAAGDVPGDRAQQFADDILVQLGIWEEEE